MRRAAESNVLCMRRRAAFVVALVGGLLPLTGCATKKDVRTLQGELLSMRASQDSTLRVLQLENRMLLDSLRKAMNITQDASGQTSHRFQQLEATLAETQDLVGQVMQMGQALANRLDNFGTPAQPGGGLPGATAPAGDPEEIYTAGTEYMAEGSYSTAQVAFQKLLRDFPNHERAPDAQFQLGESYAGEKAFARAVEELEKVAQLWPDSERAPEALYRAGMIAADSLSPKQPRKARELLERVVGTYPQAPSAGPARTKLRNLPR